MVKTHRIEGFSGELLNASHSEYDAARKLWNGMIDRKPELIARTVTEEDVAAVITHARELNLPLAVRGGGHSMQGLSSCDNGVVLDLSPLNQVKVDPEAKRVRVGGGTLLGEMDRATAGYGLATTAGAISHTGAGGLILGGGFGYLARNYGLSIDNLISAKLVLASGEPCIASEAQNSDLFWAIRGGGGNFGVVTEFELQLHEVNQLSVGITAHKLQHAGPAMRYFRDVMLDAPDELTWGTFLRKSPRFDYIPPELAEEPLCTSLIIWTGSDQDEGKAVISRLIDELQPDFNIQTIMPYSELQQAFDLISEKGVRAYCKSGMIDDLSDRALDKIREVSSAVVSWRSQFELFRLGGAIDRVAPDATAYLHRGSRWLYNIVSFWDDARDDERNISWCRDSYAAVQPFSTDKAFVNFMGGDEAGGPQAAYGGGATMDKLTALKLKYDPNNIFSLNLNLCPPG